MAEKESNLVQVVKKEYSASIINLDEEIKGPHYYRDAFQVLREAEAQDHIILEINSPGGYLSTVCQFAAEIAASKAQVHANIAEAHSAAALIALCCDNMASNEHSIMFLHTARSSLYYEKPKEMKSYAEFFEKRMEKLLRVLCKGFLTKKETEDLINGKDFWFDHEEIIRRVKRWVPLSVRRRKDKGE